MAKWDRFLERRGWGIFGGGRGQRETRVLGRVDSSERISLGFLKPFGVGWRCFANKPNSWGRWETKINLFALPNFQSTPEKGTEQSEERGPFKQRGGRGKTRGKESQSFIGKRNVLF